MPTVEAPPEIPELRFATGMPGFEHAHRFALVRWGEDESPFSLLRSLDDDTLAFVVVPPWLFFPDYAPELDDDVAERLALHDAEDALVLTVVTVGEPVSASTANLLAPIVVNLRTLDAAQVVLAGAQDDLRTPLVAGAATAGA